MKQLNHRIVLEKRPQGIPQPSDFRTVAGYVGDPPEGQFLIKHHYVGLSPAARLRLDNRPSYAAPLALGETIYGPTVGEVVKSRHALYREGDIVTSFGGWQEYSLSNGRGAEKFDTALGPVSSSLGIYGISGNTAYVGLKAIGKVAPGETVVVSAASGAVGSLAGQIAKIYGCRVVGIAGGPAKCAYVVDELGFDACVDHRSDTFSADLAASCPEGVDVDFENAGGKVRDRVLETLNDRARIVLCGLVAEYNEFPTFGPSWSPILTKQLLVQGFLLKDYRHLRKEFLENMAAWRASGLIRYREDIHDGLESAPAAFAGMLEGRNFGKTLVRVGSGGLEGLTSPHCRQHRR